MSKNYDNWERLVRAVLRRESDRQFAYIQSCSDSSSISASTTLDLSFNSTARFDQDDNGVSDKITRVLLLYRELAMNYGNWERLALERDLSNKGGDSLERDFKALTLHHSKWKTLLAPHQKELVLKSASLSFFVDERTGENRFLLGAANLIISVDSVYEDLCTWYSQSKSRFSEVPLINESRDLDIRGRIKAQMLSPTTFYTAHLVFAFTESYDGLLAADSSIRTFHNESDYNSKKQERMVLLESCHGIADGWMEVELGYFYVYLDEVVEVQVQFRNETAGRNNMKGLIIEGIEFRPAANRNGCISSTSSDVNNQRSQLLPMDYCELKLDYKDWKTMLPPDTREVVWRSSSLGFFLDERTGKNCFLLGATKLTMSRGNDIQNQWETIFHPQSRFSEVVQLKGSQNLYIEGGIKREMLCPDSYYAAYLVFGLSETQAGLHSAFSVVRSFNVETGSFFPNEEAGIVDLQQGEGRADGWMEVKLGDFYIGQIGEMIRVQLLEMSQRRKYGLIVEGMEFRPLLGTSGCWKYI